MLPSKALIMVSLQVTLSVALLNLECLEFHWIVESGGDEAFTQ